MIPILLDFETQATLHISNPLYTSHPDTIALCMSWGFKGCGGSLWWPGDPLPQAIRDHVAKGGLLGASNARFDREIWNFVCVEDHDFPPVPLKQWFCTQAQTRIAGLPSALDKAAKALGLNVRKSLEGNALIKKCCIPPFSTDPQDYADLGAYCVQDFVVMDKVARSVPDMTPEALADYQLNEIINDRGIKIDRPLAQSASQYAEAERREINIKLDKVSCGFITKCTQYKRVGTWLRECLEDDGLDDAVKLMIRHKTDKETGVTTKKYSADKNVRANMMAAHDERVFVLPDDVVEVLSLMFDAGGSAVSKFGKMDLKADPDDDRVRGVLRYAGAASTHRFSSMGLQVHNFRRDAFSYEEVKHLREQMLVGKILKDMAGEYIPVMDTLGKLLRGAIIPEKGKVFVVGDWNAIESRMNAWISGEQSKLDMFIRGDCPYEYAAEGIYGRKITKENDPYERGVGKVVDLACGFLGGVGALRSMAAQYRVYVDPKKEDSIVAGYRAKHPKIVAYADALLAAAHRSVIHPDVPHVAGKVTYLFNSKDGALYCTLPDGTTKLRYPECRFEMKPVPWDETELRPQLTALKAAFTPRADVKEWTRHGLWRGVFIENVVQATCAKLLRECIADCEEENLNVIFHVHDEIILEVDEDKADEALKLLQTIMEYIPDWLDGLPLVAKPEIMRVYGK